jgi:hypothetical protein
MKRLFITIFFIGCLAHLNAQKRESDKIYWTALEKYTTELDRLHNGSATKNTGKIIYLEKPGFIDSIPRLVNGYQIILITSLNQQKLYKEHENVLTHTKVFPLTVEDSLLRISFIPFGGRLEGRNHYSFGNGGGTVVYFKFDCTKNQFVFSKVKTYGL